MQIASLVEIDAPVDAFGGAAAGGGIVKHRSGVFVGPMSFGYVKKGSMARCERLRQPSASA